MIDNRKYVIFNLSEIKKINFVEILEDSQQTLRKNFDGTKSFIKWETIEDPSFLNDLNTKEGPYNSDEMLEILQSPNWSV